MIPWPSMAPQEHFHIIDSNNKTIESFPERILCIVGPTASGKSSRAVKEALSRNGEVISVDSRQVYRKLDIGTEKITFEERCGIPHHLIDIREVSESYSAGDFITDARQLIQEISGRGKLPILVGGTHFYFDALLCGLPVAVGANMSLREKLKNLSTEELYERVRRVDARRAAELDPRNRRRLIRALEIIDALGIVPLRNREIGSICQIKKSNMFTVEWIVLDPPQEELRARIDARLKNALARGLIDEVKSIRTMLSIHNFDKCQNYDYADSRLFELGLEYKIICEYFRGDRTKDSLFPALSAKLWQYARRQKTWLRKLKESCQIKIK